MRADLRIGLIVGLLLVIAMVVYFVTTRSGDGPAEEVSPLAATESQNRQFFAPETETASPPDDPYVVPSLDGLPDSPPAEIIAEAPVVPAATEVTPADSGWTLPPISPLTPPPAITPPAEPVLREEIYIVIQGDSLWSIAAKKYGDGRLNRLIARANNLPLNATLRLKQKLTIPPKPAPAGRPSAGRPGATGTGTTIYKVQADDTKGFWGIAKKHYGGGRHWPIIARANPNANPKKLRIGQELVLPPLDKSAAAAPAAAAPAVPAPANSTKPTAEPEPEVRGNPRPIFD